MKSPNVNKNNKGFSLIELIIAMTITLVLLSIVSTLLSAALATRRRESRKTDALVSSQAAINLMSHELSNSGFGLTTNGIVIADSDAHRIHFRANIENNDEQTNAAGEDIVYYFDTEAASIMRFDRNESPQTSVVVNRISEITFHYFEYNGNYTPIAQTAPNDKTAKIIIHISVQLEPVQGQPDNQTVAFTSDVMLKNSKYMLNQF
jgi:prepilin-type N-terminal cleavage/methylation domain-containing protein